MTKEKPILFSSEMVRALLDGRKTMTRRVLKPQPCGGNPLIWKNFGWFEGASLPDIASACPQGREGDRLWVKETFWMDSSTLVHYRADDWKCKENEIDRWKPSIFMPRWASRITLEITSVRVERLQEISEADAKAEGVKGIPRSRELYPTDDFIYPFSRLWDSIQLSRSKPEGAFSWQSNPFCWVIEFRKL